MCGIAGFLTASGQNCGKLEAIAKAMANTLRHRGPDDDGVWIDADAGIALAHRRLAIHDLSPAGHQPMTSASGRHVLVYNGEVYNFLELRTELARCGYSFQGRSDTEVLLAALEEWGLEGAPERLVGMFALALWDRKERQLHLVRDRMGEKPLYYGWIGKTFGFASELKALRAHPEWVPETDRAALTLYMRYGYVPAPWSIQQRIYKLVPGSQLTVGPELLARPAVLSPHPDGQDSSTFRPRRYWSVQQVADQGLEAPVSDPEDASARLESLLRQVVRNQLVSDVPLGAFLSGGIDSSTVAAVMQTESPAPVKTYTVGFREKDFNEAPYAAAVAKHLGTDHTELYVSADDALKLIPEIPRIYDEPYADPSAIPAHLVARMARRHVTVCLSGDGGDELFAGYNRYLWTETLWQRFGWLPLPLRATAAAAVKEHLPRLGHKIHKAAAALGSPEILDAYRGLLSYWNDPTAVVLEGTESGDPNGQNRLPAHLPFLDQAMRWDQCAYLPDDNLAKVDRASMAVGLETRLPLLDHRVVAFAWRCPPQVRASGQQGKQVLRRLLARHVPPQLFARPKMGFSVPVGAWLRGPLREWAHDLLVSRSLADQGLIAATTIQRALVGHMSGRADNDLALWSALMFQAWYTARLEAPPEGY
jgi:asparagine synthase (glutamine-hydrolysing)